DLLTQPELALDDAQREAVKASAKHLLARLHDNLVLDWRRKADATAGVRLTISEVLDSDLPEEPYPRGPVRAKGQAGLDQVMSACRDDGTSVYTESVEPAGTPPAATTAMVPDLETITSSVIERIRVDAGFASLVAAQLGMPGAAALRTVAELIANDEDYAVE